MLEVTPDPDSVINRRDPFDLPRWRTGSNREINIARPLEKNNIVFHYLHRRQRLRILPKDSGCGQGVVGVTLSVTSFFTTFCGVATEKNHGTKLSQSTKLEYNRCKRGQ